MSRKSLFKEHVDSVKKAKREHTLTLSGYLRYEKWLSEEEIESLSSDEETKLRNEHEKWLEEFNKYDFDKLREIFKIVYPHVLKYQVCHFKRVKRLLMKALKLNRWDFDKVLLTLMKKSSDGGLSAFYLMSCGSRPGGRLNYVSYSKRGVSGTFRNSFCYIRFDDRNKFAKQLIEEWREGR